MTVDLRRSLRYALTGPNPLAGWRENPAPSSWFPGRMAQMFHKTWCMELPSTVTATGERTRRPTVEGARCFSQMRVHWSYLLRMQATPYDIDQAHEAERVLVNHINTYWPMQRIAAWTAADGALLSDVDQPVGGYNIHWESFAREERPFGESEEVPSFLVHGVLTMQIQHVYDWS